MGQILHGSAGTTASVRRAIRHSQESLRALAKRHGINQSCAAADAPGEHRTRATVARWRRRTAVKDLPAGPKDARSTVLILGLDEWNSSRYAQRVCAARARAFPDPTGSEKRSRFLIFRVF